MMSIIEIIIGAMEELSAATLRAIWTLFILDVGIVVLLGLHLWGLI